MILIKFWSNLVIIWPILVRFYLLLFHFIVNFWIILIKFWSIGHIRSTFGSLWLIFAQFYSIFETYRGFRFKIFQLHFLKVKDWGVHQRFMSKVCYTIIVAFRGRSLDWAHACPIIQLSFSRWGAKSHIWLLYRVSHFKS